jgi:hypothetical protein
VPNRATAFNPAPLTTAAVMLAPGGFIDSPGEHWASNRLLGIALRFAGADRKSA